MENARQWGTWYDPIGDMDWQFRDSPPPEQVDTTWEDYQKKLKQRCLDIPVEERESLEYFYSEKLRDTLACAGIRSASVSSEEYSWICKRAKLRFKETIGSFRSNALTLKEFASEVTEIREWVSLTIFPEKAPLWWEFYG